MTDPMTGPASPQSVQAREDALVAERDKREARLPMWAQEALRYQRARIAELTARVSEAEQAAMVATGHTNPETSLIVADLGTSAASMVGLPVGAQVVFRLANGKITVSHHRGGVLVDAMPANAHHGLALVPDSSFAARAYIWSQERG